MPWLRPDELRIGLGCMRLDPNDSATVEAALEAGITVLDTARAYEGSEAPRSRASAAHRTLANALGARYVAAS
jgi:aryl-alcohol dehydrogenase-like predicted oxidoreductase